MVKRISILDCGHGIKLKEYNPDDDDNDHGDAVADYCVVMTKNGKIQCCIIKCIGNGRYPEDADHGSPEEEDFDRRNVVREARLVTATITSVPKSLVFLGPVEH